MNNNIKILSRRQQKELFNNFISTIPQKDENDRKKRYSWNIANDDFKLEELKEGEYDFWKIFS